MSGRDWRQQRVLQGYSDRRIVNTYASRKPALWKAEEILIPRYFTPGGTILDIGCGTGRTAIPLSRMGYRVTAIDLSLGMVRQASQEARRYNAVIDFLEMDVMHLAFPDETFDDALFAYNGIELLPGLGGKRQALREVWRVLKSGGHVFLTSHSLYALNDLFFFRIRHVLRFYVTKLLKIPIEEQEVGERLIEDDFETGYMQVVAPGVIKQLARDAGFEVVYDNTRGRVENGKPPGWLMDCEKSERCYVLRK
jgi:ubiquinone/menaquinone biosynthesis C-methylase UbiE